MLIRKSAALVSATLFLASFTIMPALAIIAQPAQTRQAEFAGAKLASPDSTNLSAPTLVTLHRQASLDDAIVAARIVEPEHPESATTATAESQAPDATPAPPAPATVQTTAVPALATEKTTTESSSALTAPELDPGTETLNRGTTGLGPSSGAGPIVRMPWFGEAETVYAKGDVATVVDLETGIRLQIQRTGGHNHADVETVDAAETAKLLQVAGGEWNWTRRPIIVEIDGQRIAASMTCRPHAGLDNQPALETVRNRSGGFGTGVNYDSIKGNDMDGHFDIHFYKSRTHSTGKIDAEHQAAIEVAYRSGL